MVSETPDERLLAATEYGVIGAAAQALRDGANPNALQPGTWDGSTIMSLYRVPGHSALRQAVTRAALWGAHMPDPTQMVRLLLDHGADPKLRSNEETPLGTAARFGDPDLVALLLERGAGQSVLGRNDWGMTPLDHAIGRMLLACDGATTEREQEEANRAKRTVALLRDATHGARRRL